MEALGAGRIAGGRGKAGDGGMKRYGETRKRVGVVQGTEHKRGYAHLATLRADTLLAAAATMERASRPPSSRLHGMLDAPLDAGAASNGGVCGCLDSPFSLSLYPSLSLSRHRRLSLHPAIRQ